MTFSSTVQQSKDLFFRYPPNEDSLSFQLALEKGVEDFDISDVILTPKVLFKIQSVGGNANTNVILEKHEELPVIMILFPSRNIFFFNFSHSLFQFSSNFTSKQLVYR